MKLAVVGSRNFNDYPLMKKYLDKIHSIEPITLIVSGGALGADTYAECWAEDNKVSRKIFKPEWNKYGKKAGFLRNVTIIENSNKVIAFWDGKSRGTKHSIDLAKKQGKKCKIVYTDKKYIRAKKLKKLLDKIKPKKSLF